MIEIYFFFRLAVLTFDAMSTQPSFRYNPTADVIEGFADCGMQSSRPSLTEPADHLFVVYLRGLSSSWKQPIGFMNTKNSPSVNVLRSVVNEVISRAYEHGKFRALK